MQLPKVTEITRLSAHQDKPTENAPRQADATRVGAWPSNQPQSSSTESGSGR